MSTTTIKARLFSISEYGFNNFIIYDINYKNKILSVNEFQKIYNTLPKRNFSFMEIVC